jgi:hypothetical protein
MLRLPYITFLFPTYELLIGITINNLENAKLAADLETYYK